MIKNKKILGLLGLSMKAGKVCFGTDSTIEQIRKRKVKLVMVAQDASDRTKKNFQNLCEDSQIPLLLYGTIEENSNAIGKIEKAVIGIKEQHFAEQIEKIYNRG